MRTLAIACIVAIAGCGSHEAAHVSVTHEVVIRGMQYVPATLDVEVGDLVLFKNQDLVPHTVTDEGWFDSGPLAPNNQWSYVIDQPVELDYRCTFHPTMHGKLRGHR